MIHSPNNWTGHCCLLVMAMLLLAGPCQAQVEQPPIDKAGQTYSFGHQTKRFDQAKKARSPNIFLWNMGGLCRGEVLFQYEHRLSNQASLGVMGGTQVMNDLLLSQAGRGGASATTSGAVLGAYGRYFFDDWPEGIYLMGSVKTKGYSARYDSFDFDNLQQVSQWVDFRLTEVCIGGGYQINLNGFVMDGGLTLGPLFITESGGSTRGGFAANLVIGYGLNW